MCRFVHTDITCFVQEEATGYEAPRKSFKKAAESQSWQAATVCLANRVAKLSVADTKDCMTSGQVPVAGK